VCFWQAAAPRAIVKAVGRTRKTAVIPEEAKTIGIRIAEQRKKLGLTQAQLAERAGLDSVYLSQLERGQRLPSLQSLLRLAALLKVKPGNLLDDTSQPDDSLLREIREQLHSMTPAQQKAILKAIKALKEV
jgi:transcriptional regulator with XRE-family HTH domain